MKVKLISHTEKALELLIFTKDTRLKGGQTLEEIALWPIDKKLEHLAYMLDTIQSSWEFVDYVFKISGVTRAFTHQLVRTRTNSYAQEAQRVVDLSDAEWRTPEIHRMDAEILFDAIMANAINGYAQLRKMNVAPQDARGVIPTNVHTSIIVKVNLRTMSDMAKVRLCTRTQGEYQDVFRAMKAEVVRVHPWADRFIDVFCVKHGTCAFPRYTECPVQAFTYHGNPAEHAERLSRIKEVFYNIRHEANPVAFKDSAQTEDFKKDGEE
jgi:flavin-dependent thymidylate synthase